MAAGKPEKGKAKDGGAKKTRTAQGGLAKPVKPDDKLAAIVGSAPLTRADLTKKVWDYVKSNNLQDPNDRRTIRADAKLKPVFGGKEKVSMFEMTKLVNQHVSSV
ncbi:MAG: SWIB/MDM2 domain-containing protein [Gemmatimonadota bacterium]